MALWLYKRMSSMGRAARFDTSRGKGERDMISPSHPWRADDDGDDDDDNVRL